MTMTCILFLTAALGVTAEDQGKDASAAELEKLRGTWLTVSLIHNGKQLVDENDPPKEGPVTKLVYEGNKWMVKVGDKTVATGIIQVDATKTPKELDVLDQSGTLNEKSKLAIYELNGDSFRYCIAPAGKPRPTECTSKEGSGHSLIVSKREKK